MSQAQAQSDYRPLIVTAAFGEQYRWALGGLLASLRESNPDLGVLVFSESEVEGTPTCVTELERLLDEFPPYYRSGRSRANVTKFAMLRIAADRFSPRDLLWIDADSLVLADLGIYGRRGAINLNRHGGRTGQTVDCGNGLVVRGEEYAVGCIWGMPNSAGPFEYFRTIVEERQTWPDADRMVSGDQILLNHLRRDISDNRVDLPLHWMSDQTDDIVNYRIAGTRKGHPSVGRSNYRHVRLDGLDIRAAGEKIGLWMWTADTLFHHRRTAFRSFRRDVRGRLRRLYGMAD